jgi:23S rRNA (cytosine1962-C5)-methyltransferase
MHLQKDLIAAAIVAASGGIVTDVYDKSKESLPGQYARTIENAWLIGETETPLLVCENSNYFLIDWVTGQKTGFFLDQRDNRHLLGKYAKGKSVLNTFCYTGGFSLYALQGGASLVHSVDVSAKAMLLTQANILHAGDDASTRHEGFTEDVMPFLKNDTLQYDIVIVDPPAFAKTLDKRHNAVQGYKRLNVAALQRVVPGGLFFTFSCSQVIDRALFYNTIVASALEAGRKARVIHHLSQSPDHPVNIFHPEGSYLKGLVLYIE